MARLAIGLPVEPVVLAHRHPADDRDAVVHRLAVQDLMRIAELAERRVGKVAVDHLGFLQAQDVGRFLAQKALDDVDAKANRIDVPGSDLERIGPDCACRQAAM